MELGERHGACTCPHLPKAGKSTVAQQAQEGQRGLSTDPLRGRGGEEERLYLRPFSLACLVFRDRLVGQELEPLWGSMLNPAPAAPFLAPGSLES